MIRVLQHRVVFLLIILAGIFNNSYAVDQDVIRVRIGLKLFRTILAADNQINTKKDAEGNLALVIIYKSNKEQADLYGEQLENSGKGIKQGKIKGIPIVVHTITLDQLESLSNHKYAGIYIIEELDHSVLQKVVNYAIEQQIISYSPVLGAVEKGVSAGLIIEARVKPYVNLNTLKSSQLDIKSFFMKVSKHYEP